MLSLFNRSLNQLSSSILIDHSGLVEQHIVLALVKLFGIFQCGSHLAPERGPPGARFFYCLAEWRNRKTVMPQELEGIKDSADFRKPALKFAWRVSFSFWSLKNFSENQNLAKIGIDLATPWPPEILLEKDVLCEPVAQVHPPWESESIGIQ
jgi:hypothetical protein